MWQWNLAAMLGLLAAVVGCSEKAANIPGKTSPSPAAKPTTSTRDESAGDQMAEAADKPESNDDRDDEPVVGEDSETPSLPVELKLESITFLAPATWKKVKPPNNIIEAEFELPRAAPDEFDGRLTLMSSGGNVEEVIATRSGEFVQDPGQGPRIETFRVADVEVTWVDIRGEWKGPVFQPITPRADYRMLLVIIPLRGTSNFYAKLTGPRETIAAREEEFRKFIQSARVTLP